MESIALPPFQTSTAPQEGRGKRPGNLSRPELSIVMPVYNEDAVIAEVVTTWIQELERLDIDYEFLVYDDGSEDETGRVLERLAWQQHGLMVTRKANSGHGPTILRGYREAIGEWVFQVDSDGEISPEPFPSLWKRRDDYDLLIGRRQHRGWPLTRRLITATSRATLRTLFGDAVTDVNAPYRLIRRSSLVAILSMIPDDTLAPNVIISELAARSGLRVREVLVPHRGRRARTRSIVRWLLWKAAVHAVGQTVGVALRGRSRNWR
jgi:glycosyltransferase involved in cell wall biosynthesis